MRINERIDECVSLQFTAGPRYRTDSVPLDNGGEVRNRRWMYPLQEYSASFQNVRREVMQEILRFQHAAAGRWLDFRFKDWSDFEAINQPLSPVIGTQTPVQLVKTYTAGAHTSERIIQAVVSATILADGSPVAGTPDYELGLFTPDADWAAATYTWSGEFDVWVHFTEDYNPFSATDYNHWSSAVTLVESRQFPDPES